MSDSTNGRTRRKVVAQVEMSIDGFVAGPDEDMAFLLPHVTSEQMDAYSEGIWRGADTALMGRVNYEGFASYWPPVARDPSVPPRTRDIAVWLDTVDKVVFSRTMQEADWHPTRVSNDLEGEVRALRDAPGRDILVLNSSSIIRQLLDLDLLDELRLSLLPEVVGTGQRLFEDEVPRSSWKLVATAVLSTGAVGLTYQRA